MQYRYDTDADALYVTLSDSIVDRTTALSDPNVLIDYDAQGRPVGIEVIHPERAWPVAEIREAFGTLWADLLSSAFDVLGIGPSDYPSRLGSHQQLAGA